MDSLLFQQILLLSFLGLCAGLLAWYIYKSIAKDRKQLHHGNYSPGDSRVEVSCEAYGCAERGKRYWLPLEVIELDQVDANPPAQ